MKIRPSRFERVREEVQLADGQILEIAEFLHPRVQEIADTLPAGLGLSAAGQWLAAPTARTLHQKGRCAEDLHDPWLPHALFCRGAEADAPTLAAVQAEQAFLEDWLRKLLSVARGTACWRSRSR